jgi:hypothetical protein
MQCDECGRQFRPARSWQHFCSPRCRDTYNNRGKKYAAEQAEREQYRAEVAAHEARINGYTQIDLAANEPPKLKGPTLGVRPLNAEPKKKEEARELQTLASAVGAQSRNEGDEEAQVA